MATSGHVSVIGCVRLHAISQQSVPPGLAQMYSIHVMGNVTCSCMQMQVLDASVFGALKTGRL